MPRTTVVEGITLRKETVSPSIVINWNPLTDDGTVVFGMSELEFLNDEYIRTTRLQDLAINIADITQRSVQLETHAVTGLDVMLFIKGLVDQLIAEEDEANAPQA